ncbi:MAG: flagellar hook-basal body protein [Curvibacter sp.]|nr:flagellar hook-basal body protein [Curvibacter sp.]
MQEIIALSLQSIHQDMERLDRIATNMANATTPGYKRQMMAPSPVAAGASDFSRLVDGGGAGRETNTQTGLMSLSPSFQTMVTDSRAGTLKVTGESLDLALTGPGYFEVATENGPAYTRQGDFRRDAKGRLVNSLGMPVMGVGGEIFLEDNHPVIDATGQVFSSTNSSSKASASVVTGRGAGRGMDGQALARIKVVNFDSPGDLQPLGNGLVLGKGSTSALKDKDIHVQQGALENSNVSTMREMVDLIQTMRHLESMQKVAVAYDDMTGQAVRRLADLS